MNTTETALKALDLLKNRQLRGRGGGSQRTSVTVMRIGKNYVLTQGSSIDDLYIRTLHTWPETAEAMHKLLHPELKGGH